jgi:hypothetical protein
MSWLDEQIAKREELRSCEALLNEHAPKVFADLWDRIGKIIKETEGKIADARFLPTGSVSERRVTSYPVAATVPDRQVTLTLSPDARSVSAHYIYEVFQMEDIMFDIGISNYGVVCLKRNGDPVSGQEAAEMIIGPLLFPELYQEVTMRPVSQAHAS